MQLPQMFGDYKLVRHIATGGMGELFVAERSGVAGFSKQVVVKRIRAELATDQAFVEMFLNEGHVAALLDHPNIVHIYELGQVDGAYFMAMEYVAGWDLGSVIERLQVPFDPAVALYVMLGICEGLDFAHNATGNNGQPLQLVHRDINPQNVLLSSAGAVKITDFGIAKVQARHRQQTRAGVLKGKFGYLAPEQARGQRVDRRCDIYTLGLLLFEVTTGQPAIPGESTTELLHAAAHGIVQDPRTVAASYPPGLHRIYEKATARLPENRYQTVKELQEDLLRYQMDERLLVTPGKLAALLRELFGAEPAPSGGADSSPSAGGQDHTAVARPESIAADGLMSEPTQLEATRRHRSPKQAAAPSRPASTGPHVPGGGGPLEDAPTLLANQLRASGDAEDAPTAALHEQATALRRVGREPPGGAAESDPDAPTTVSRPSGEAGSLAEDVDDLADTAPRPAVGDKRESGTLGALVEGDVQDESTAVAGRPLLDTASTGGGRWIVAVVIAAVVLLAGGAGLAYYLLVVRPDDGSKPPGLPAIADGRADGGGGAAAGGGEPDTRPVAPSPDARVESEPDGEASAAAEPTDGAAADTSASATADGGESEPSAPSAPDSGPPAHRPGQQRVRIAVTPRTVVYYKGRRLGRSPVTARLPSGRARLLLVDHKRAIRVVRTVRIKPGRARLSFKLRRGFLQVKVRPWAHVIIDGKRRGTTPLKPIPLYEGRHRLQLINDRLKKKYRRRITIHPHKRTVVVYHFRR